MYFDFSIKVILSRELAAPLIKFRQTFILGGFPRFTLVLRHSTSRSKLNTETDGI